MVYLDLLAGYNTDDGSVMVFLLQDKDEPFKILRHQVWKSSGKLIMECELLQGRNVNRMAGLVLEALYFSGIMRHIYDGISKLDNSYRSGNQSYT